MKMKSLVAAAAVFATTLPAFAAEKTTLASVLAASDITVSGRVDASYDYANTQNDSAPLAAAFNTGSNTYALHQAALRLAKAPSAGVGGAVTLLMGEDAKVINSATGDSESQFSLVEGYLSYTQGNATVYAGRLLTLAGAEVIDSSANFNATRGLLFNVQPLLHTGVRGSYKVNDQLSVTGGVMNSVGVAKTDSNDQKTIELNGVLTTGALTNALTVYVGDESSSKDAGQSTIIDLVTSYPVNDKLTLVANADYFANELAKQNTADGYGFAGYANYKVGPACRVAARAEYVKLNEAHANLSAYTLTYGHTVTNGLELMTEVRYDAAANNQVFNTIDGDNQFIGTVKAVYKF